MEVLKQLLGIGLENLEWYQMAMRAILVFFVAMGIIHLAGMRSFGNRTPFDVVVSITIGALFSRCITGHYPILPCFAGAVALAVCHRLVGYLTYRFNAIRSLAEGDSVKLYDNGIFINKAMKRYMINDADIQKALREKGIANIESVSTIWYENDGKINILKKEPKS
jgi:uncharacterized membrane protein YcaP (DUF421 family)